MVHVVRRRVESVNHIFMALFGSVLRPAEIDNIPSAFYFLLGANVAVTFCSLRVATLSLSYVTFGDPSASFFGSKFTSFRFSNGKSIAGLVACITTCAACTIFYFSVFETVPFDSCILAYVRPPYTIIAIKHSLNHYQIIVGSISAGKISFQHMILVADRFRSNSRISMLSNFHRR